MKMTKEERKAYDRFIENRKIALSQLITAQIEGEFKGREEERKLQEAKIKQILQENNISFIEQYGFDDCKSNKNYKLRFDFAIFVGTNLHCLVEFQGIQHFQPSPQFDQWETLEERQERDNIKRDYCKKNNITLIEIPYTDKNKLDWNYLKEKCNL